MISWLVMTSDPRQVPTLPVLCDVELETGRTASVTVFLSITSATHAGPETLDEFLNAPRRLLPVVYPASEKHELLSRAAIVSVRVTSEISPSAEVAAPLDVDMVHAELSSGRVIDGVIKHARETRLSDFFNAAPDFFVLEDSRGPLRQQASRRLHQHVRSLCRGSIRSSMH